ncbi:hypothetical protein HMPREF0083_03366 [Aneurinibacillus aneurinilyticus ATCC 12856]|uniref:Uncharacterized protein n=1 Tax=Aneurinibacillus aneurinilyticus ATCC 12856 TaxID=649747 RepID=U1YCI2_ANEAE|nr:hypothetical protein HMPREF0083_03366 [Aneurinibacillus aneurinilyticus ATCC 12856]
MNLRSTNDAISPPPSIDLDESKQMQKTQQTIRSFCHKRSSAGFYLRVCTPYE